MNRGIRGKGKTVLRRLLIKLLIKLVRWFKGCIPSNWRSSKTGWPSRGAGRRRLAPRALVLLLGVVLAVFASYWSDTGVKQFPFSPPVQIRTSELTVRVLNHRTGRVMNLALDDYLIGVVAAEMPASFHPSALAAQAIAARTYTLKRIKAGQPLITGDSTGHPNADLCTDPTHCQAWKSREEMLRDWGVVNFPSYYRRIAAAVRSTSGIVITYQGELIDPVYHSTCGGATENSEDVWFYKIPYLRSVPCNYCSFSPHFREEIFISWRELEEQLGAGLALPVAAAYPHRVSFLQVEKRTATGRLKSLRVGDHSFLASEFRQRLGLPSTRLQWRETREGVVFVTRGYGHGVGMCQYGAQGMALQGKSPQEILQYYYRGVQVQKMGS